MDPVKKNGNVILDFSQIYPENTEAKQTGISRVELGDLSGTDMYCSAQAEAEIRRRLKPYGPGGIHFLDSGNYHYVTKFFTEKISEPFSLILYDHHSDMQPPMIRGLTSCGSWAADVLRTSPYIRQMILTGPDQKSMDEIPADLREKLVCISREEIEEGNIEQKIRLIRMNLPIYISIDKDVLDRGEARTNWNQGDMPLSILKRLLLEVFEHQRVIGVDICGECSMEEPLPELMEDQRINKKTNENLYRFLTKLFYTFCGESH